MDRTLSWYIMTDTIISPVSLFFVEDNSPVDVFVAGERRRGQTFKYPVAKCVTLFVWFDLCVSIMLPPIVHVDYPGAKGRNPQSYLVRLYRISLLQRVYVLCS